MALSMVGAVGWAPLGGLVWTLVRTDFKVRYHGTVGGFLWALLKPVAVFLVLLAVFSFVFGSDPHYRVNLIIGLFLWDFFVEGTRVGLLSLASKGYLLTKAKLPSWILVVTSTSNALVTLAVFSVIVGVYLTVSRGAPGRMAVALYVWYVLHYLGLVVGFSLAASVLFLRYRDLHQVWEVVTHAGFFVAPIVYPLGVIPERFHVYFYLWPPTSIIQFSRAVLVEGVAPSLTAHLLLSLGTLTALAIGGLIFKRYGPRAAEHV